MTFLHNLNLLSINANIVFISPSETTKSNRFFIYNKDQKVVNAKIIFVATKFENNIFLGSESKFLSKTN